jgi:hypothetical protein
MYVFDPILLQRLVARNAGRASNEIVSSLIADLVALYPNEISSALEWRDGRDDGTSASTVLYQSPRETLMLVRVQGGAARTFGALGADTRSFVLAGKIRVGREGERSCGATVVAVDDEKSRWCAEPLWLLEYRRSFQSLGERGRSLVSRLLHI